MELDLSLIEITGDDDDSLLRLEDPNPSHGIFPCSPVQAPRPSDPDTAPRPSRNGGLRTVQFADNYGVRISKENIDMNVDGTKLNMDPLQMKRTKKPRGYNMRKSLAWNKAFFTEEGVLDPEELSLVTGTFNLTNGEPLSVLQEQKSKPGKICSPHFSSPKEKMSTNSPALRRGLSPRCESSSSYRVSPAKAISSPRVRHPVLSAQDVNKSAEKHSCCQRPKSASSYKRLASCSKSSAISKEPKITKSLVPRADRCTLPTVPRTRSVLPKASFSSRILGVEAKRVVSSPKSIAFVGNGTVAHSKVVKGSLINARGIKGSSMNDSGFKPFNKVSSCPQPSSLNEPGKQPGLNKSKLPPKAPVPRDPKFSQVAEVTDQVQQQDRVCNKQNNISLQQKRFADATQRQVSHVRAGKPTGLRVPSPSLGFFGRPKQSASVGEDLRNISEISSYYPGARNLESAQRFLQAPENISMVSYEFIEPVREPLFAAKSNDIKISTMTSTSSIVVQTDISEERPQALSRELDRAGEKPSESKECDESMKMEDWHSYDNLRAIDISYCEPSKKDASLGKAKSSHREELLDSLSIEDCGVSEAQIMCCSDIQQIPYGFHRSMFGSEKQSEEIERRKCYSSETHLKGCKKSIDEKMNIDASSLKPKFGESQGLVPAARKDGLPLEDYCFSAVATKGFSDHNHSLILENEKGWDGRDHPVIEMAEKRQHDSCEASSETYKKSLDACPDNDPSPQDESIALSVEVQTCLTDSSKDCNLSALEHTCCLSRFNPPTPTGEGNIVEDIQTEVHVISHIYAPGLQNVSDSGMLNSNSQGSSYSTMDENQFCDSELKALEMRPNCSENFKLTARNSEVLKNQEALKEDNAASSSKNFSFVEEEVFGVIKLPSPGTLSDSDHEVEDLHHNVLVIDIPLQLSNTDVMADYAVPQHAQHDEIVLQKSSNQGTELQKTGSEVDFPLMYSESAVDHERCCSLSAENGSTMVDGDKLGSSSSSSQLKDLENINAICKEDASTTTEFSDQLSSDKCSHSDTSHLDCSDDQFDMHDAAPDAALQKQSSTVSYSLDVGKLEMNVTKFASPDNDSISSVAVKIEDDTSSDLGEQHPRNTTTSILKPNCMIKPPPDVVPFSDEWLAAVEAAGEDILTVKSGAVQHSPTEKSLPEPSPWSPVKRNKNQGLGPFDCTKHTTMPGGAPVDD